MNYSTRRTPSRTMSVLARALPVTGLLLCSCGSNAAPSDAPQVKLSGGGGRAPETVQVREVEPVGGPMDPKVGQTPIEGAGARPEPNVFVCHRDPVAFDLSKLQPTWSTPAAFWYGWVYANRERDVPGFVVAYTGTYKGPVQAMVGAVRTATPGTYAFMMGLHNTQPVLATTDSDPLHVKSYTDDDEFVTAFGTERTREGFRVSRIAIDGHLDSECKFLRNVSVTMWLPATNEGQHFGNQTIDEELGPATVIDPAAKLSGWVVRMQAPVLEALRITL